MRARKRRELLRDREEMESRLAKVRAKEKAQHERYLKGESMQKRRKIDLKDTSDGDEDQFILEDYDSDVGQSGASASGLSSATLALMEKLGMIGGALREEEAEIEEETKVGIPTRQQHSSNNTPRSSSALGHILNLRNLLASSVGPSFPPQYRLKIPQVSLSLKISSILHWALGRISASIQQ